MRFSAMASGGQFLVPILLKGDKRDAIESDGRGGSGEGGRSSGRDTSVFYS